MAGDESSLRTVPPHDGQISIRGSENFWMRSNLWLHWSHWYS